MLDGMKMATQGMMAMMAQQDVIANNLANVGTAGFRRDTLAVSSFSQVLNRQMGMFGPEQPGYMQAGGAVNATGGLTYSPATTYAQGSLKETGNTFDLALDDNGKGFFCVQTPEGVRFTRNGAFRRDATGHLVAQDGSPLLGRNGAITVAGDSLEVKPNGEVWAGGKLVDQILVATFDDKAALSKEGSTNFLAAAGGKLTNEFQIKQGFLEMSNVNAIQEMVNMMSVMQAYEAGQKLLQAQDKVLAKAVDLGRVR